MEIKTNYISKVNTEFNKKNNISNFRSKEISFKYIFYFILTDIFLKISNMYIHKESFNIFKSYEITIKVKGVENQNINILYNSYTNCPKKIYLNEQLFNFSDCHIISISSQESDENKINTIKLIWDNSLNSMKDMFRDCSSLISLD